MQRLNYYNNCVNWPAAKVPALCDMIDSHREISRATFLAHINREDLNTLEQDLGYAKHPKQGLTMAKDYHVRYCRSKLEGQRVYYFRHSAIEYVFV